MLVLSRKLGEKIIINGDVTVVVRRIAGNRVAIGVEAAPEVSIMRGELTPLEVSGPSSYAADSESDMLDPAAAI